MAMRMHSNWGGMHTTKASDGCCLVNVRGFSNKGRKQPHVNSRRRQPVRTTAKAYATEVDVAVIGGGPGGLAAAAAASSAFGNSLNVKVIKLLQTADAVTD